MKRQLALLLVLFLSLVSLRAQIATEIKSEKGEKWWGGLTALGSDMPFADDFESHDLWVESLGAPSSSLFLSSFGRYIYVDAPVEWSFTDGVFTISAPEEVEVKKVGRNLRAAYVVAVDKHLKERITIPDTLFYTAPHYIFNGDINEAKLESYVESIEEAGLGSAVVTLGDNWQSFNGSFAFNTEDFPSPQRVVKDLHAKGFKVLLTVTPYISADSRVYSELLQKDFLLKDKDGEPYIAKWEKGYSAVLDLNSTLVVDWCEAQLKELQANCSIDGFYFKGGALESYKENVAVGQAAGWQELSTRFWGSEIATAWNLNTRGVLTRLEGEELSWRGLQQLIPQMIVSSMMGYIFTVPSYYNIKGDQRDEKLCSRWVEATSLMPIMAVGGDPALSMESAKLHEMIAPYVKELAAEASETGEPILRPMEYNYPKQGYSDCLDQFMIGTKYLVAPIVTKDNSRLVRLPRGVWYNDKGEKFRGPLVMEVTAEVGRLPYFRKL